MNNINHWMYSLNYAQHPVCAEIIKRNKENKKRFDSSEDRRNYKVRISGDKKEKLIDDIKKILIKKQSMHRNADLFDDMLEMDLIPGDGEHLISTSVFAQCVTIARYQINENYRNVKNQICELKRSNKDLTIAEISEALKTDKMYVRQSLVREGLIEKKIKSRGKKNAISQ